jgi:hypothetical protein
MLYRELPISQPDDDDILGALVGRAKQGSVDAFAELADRIRFRVRQWAARVVHDDDAALRVAARVALISEWPGGGRFPGRLWDNPRQTGSPPSVS